MVQFNFTYDPSVSVEQRVGFELAAMIWSSYLTDDITVNLHIASSDRLGENGQAVGGAIPIFHEQNYGIYQEYAAADATSDTDDVANENLQDGNTTDVLIDGQLVDGNTNILLTSAQAKALGMDEALDLEGGGTWDRDLVDANALDGYILVSNAFEWNYDYTRSGEAPEGTLDFMSMALHEIGHQLGFVSGLDGALDLNELYSGETQADGFTILDLFRHSDDSSEIDNPDGAVSDLTRGQDSYFSIDGGNTNLANFSNGAKYQASHWERMRVALGIMDPTLAYQERTSVGSLDLRAMDVLGWDVNYDMLDTGLDLNALLQQAEQVVAQDLGLESTLLTDNRTSIESSTFYNLGYGELWKLLEQSMLALGYGELWQAFELGYGELWQEYGKDIFSLGYGELWQMAEENIFALGYGELWQQFETEMFELGYGELWQQFETEMFELGYGELWQVFEQSMLALGYGELWQQFELGYGELWQEYGNDIFNLGYGELWQLIEDNIFELGYGELWQQFETDMLELGYGELWQKVETDMLELNYGQLWQKLSPFFSTLDKADSGENAESTQVVSGGFAQVGVVRGGQDDDIIAGSDEQDRVVGGAGDDLIDGKAGDDIIWGDTGRDIIYGQDGFDRLHGGDGDDFIAGEQEGDQLYGEGGADILSGGHGNDIVSGGTGRDELKGGDHKDVLQGGDGDDALSGGNDHDFLMGAAGRDQASADAGNDVLYGDQVLAESRAELNQLRTDFLRELWHETQNLRQRNASIANQESLGNSISETDTTTSSEPSEANGLMRIQAESMTLFDGYVHDAGDDTIRNASSTTGGRALTTFEGEAGYYMVAVRYFDESDGQSTLTVNVGGQTIDSWQFTNDDDQYASRVISTQLYLSPGETIELIGDTQSGERARVDYIDLIPTDGLLETYVDGNEPITLGQNLFENGDFSSDLSGWTISQGNAQTVTTDAYEGHSLSFGQNSTAYRWVDIFGGQTYEFSTIAKSTEGQWGGIGIQFYDANWQLLDEQEFEITTDDWTTYQNSFVTAENARYASFWAATSDHSGQLLIDNVVLQEQLEVSVNTAPSEREDLSIYQNKPWDDGLVAHWSFDDATNNRSQDSLNGLSVRLDNRGTADVVQGMVGNALDFNGVNEKATIKDASSLQLGENNADFSIAFWFKLQEDTTGDWRTIIDKGDTWGNHTFATSLRDDSNHLFYSVSTTASSNESGQSQSELVVNQWTHVSYVKSGDQLSLYLDGQLDSSVTVQGEVNVNNDPLRIASNSLKASIDELKIYNRALTTEDLKSLALYNADLLEGGQGQDTLYGDEGNDQLYGESESTFELTSTQASIGVFNGTEAQVFEHQDSMLVNNGTLSFSFSADDMSSEQGLLSKDSSNYDDGGHLTVSVDNNQLKVRIQSASASYVLLSENLESNRVYDAAITFGDRGLELWVDGRLVATGGYKGGLGSNSGGSGNREPIVLGASQSYSGDLVANELRNYFSGTLQNVRLFNQQLDSNTISQLSTAPPSNAVFEAFSSDASNNDVLVGGKGHDTIYGNAGDDILYGDEATVLTDGIQYNGSLYLLTQETTWHDAQAQAELWGGNLVTLNDAEEEDWLQQTFGTSERFWLGITDEAVDGQFEWVSGEEVTYTNWWADQQGSEGSEDYVYLNQGIDNQWGTLPTWFDSRGIIEIELPEESGNDVMVGGIGNDVIYGELGDDIIDGSNGQARGAFERDVLAGGDGSDRFILGNTDGAYYIANGNFDYALIKDFNAAEDTIQLSGTASNYSQQQQGNDTYVYNQAELVAVLENTTSVDFNRGFSFT